MDNPLDQQYLTWLYARIGNVKESRRSRTYWDLFYFLYMKKFVWLVANDDNRVEDGKYLRYEFLDDAGLSGEVNPNWMGNDCSVMEMLVALTERLVFNTGGDRAHWFWEMMNNLGLSGYTDRSFNEIEVTDIVDRLIWRNYRPDGEGGLFPLRNPINDQRKVEIWHQLHEYIQERH